MHPRDPQREVYEAGLIVLKYANADFAAQMLRQAAAGTLTPESIWEGLCRGPDMAHIRQYENLRGFHSSTKAYNDRLTAEWTIFFKSVCACQAKTCSSLIKKITFLPQRLSEGTAHKSQGESFYTRRNKQ